MKWLLSAIILAAIATAVLLYEGAFTCRPGSPGIKIGGVVTSRGC